MLNMSIGNRFAATAAALFSWPRPRPAGPRRASRRRSTPPREDRRLPAAAREARRQRPDRPRRLLAAVKSKTEPVFGALWFTSRIETDQESALVEMLDLKVSRVRWPESTAADEATLTKAVEDAAANATVTISTDRLSASLENAEREQKSLAELKNDPRRSSSPTSSLSCSCTTGAGLERRREQQVRARDQHAVRGRAREGRQDLLVRQRRPLVPGERPARPWQPTRSRPPISCR